MENITKLTGTYHICAKCPPEKNCCRGKKLDPAVLIPEDIDSISQKTGLNTNEFSIPSIGSLSIMKSYKEDCFFYRNNKCIIYNYRPIDCQLFPFDIRKDVNGNLVLVAYISTCPEAINIDSYKESVSYLINKLHIYAEDFANHNSPILDSHSFDGIEIIRFPLVLR